MRRPHILWPFRALWLPNWHMQAPAQQLMQLQLQRRGRGKVGTWKKSSARTIVTVCRAFAARRLSPSHAKNAAALSFLVGVTLSHGAAITSRSGMYSTVTVLVTTVGSPAAAAPEAVALQAEGKRNTHKRTGDTNVQVAADDRRCWAKAGPEWAHGAERAAALRHHVRDAALQLTTWRSLW